MLPVPEVIVVLLVVIVLLDATVMLPLPLAFRVTEVPVTFPFILMSPLVCVRNATFDPLEMSPEAVNVVPEVKFIKLEPVTVPVSTVPSPVYWKK